MNVISDGSIEYKLRTIPSKNELGFRQPNTNYNVNDIAYHNSLPIGWYLQCTIAGTSNNNNLIINNPSIENTINDGTLTWKITRNLGLDGGTINGDLTVTGTINGTASSAVGITNSSGINLTNHTISEVKEYLTTTINSMKRGAGQVISIVLPLNQFIEYWNKNDTTILNGNGVYEVFFRVILLAATNHFKLLISTYINKNQYEVTCTAGAWSKINPILIASVDDNNKNSLTIDGDLTVVEAIITGGYLCRNVNNSTFDIYGGTAGEGAYMSLFGAQNEGAFYLTAKNNSSQYASLIGSALGGLTWNGNDLAGTAIIAKSLGENGYIKYASGLIIQWGQGHISKGRSDGVTTLPITTGSFRRVYVIKFSYFTPEEIIHNNNDTRDDSNRIVVISNSAASNPDGIFYTWLVISN